MEEAGADMADADMQRCSSRECLKTLGKEVLISKDIIPNIAVQNSVFLYS
jgi:hypothetical protein